MLSQGFIRNFFRHNNRYQCLVGGLSGISGQASTGCMEYSPVFRQSIVCRFSSALVASNASLQLLPEAGAERSKAEAGGSQLQGVVRKAPRHVCGPQCAPHTYWITSSAWKRSVGGMVRPRAFAVFRLMTSSNFMGCSTGRSAGLAPFRILSTNVAARRISSALFDP
jgi:hypothetical protein